MDEPDRKANPMAWIHWYRANTGCSLTEARRALDRPAPIPEHRAADARVAELVEQMFTSGNSIPVERITLTRAQWEAAKQGANHAPRT